METGFLMETKQQLSLLKSTGVYDNNSIDTVVKSDYFVSKNDFFKNEIFNFDHNFSPFCSMKHCIGRNHISKWSHTLIFSVPIPRASEILLGLFFQGVKIFLGIF